MSNRFSDVASLKDELAGVDYLSDDGIAGVVYLADRLEKPILVEGPAGTGKTQLAKSVSEITGSRLIRLQCYEGLDEAKALYEWNYKKQLLRIQAESGSEEWDDISEDIFSDEFLLTRPLLEAISADEPVVLLIDEVDRVELETEALLLEILSDYQVSIPELGTIKAKQIPLVFLTSNNTRELSEALKRRCLYLHVDYPDIEREKEIVLTKVPDITENLADQVARVVRSIRQIELKKHPSVSETLDWAKTLVLLGVEKIDEQTATQTINILLKYQSDINKALKELATADGVSPADRSLAMSVTEGAACDDAVATPEGMGDPILDLLNGFIVRAACSWTAGEPHREPRCHGGGQARSARRSADVQVRAGRDAGEAPQPLEGIRDRLRGLFLARGGDEFSIGDDTVELPEMDDEGAAGRTSPAAISRAAEATTSRPKSLPRCSIDRSCVAISR